MKGNILHPQEASRLPSAAHPAPMHITTGEGREAVGRGGLVQGLGWLDSGSAARESLPGGGKDCCASELGARSWPAGPWHAWGLLGNQGAALSAFQQAPLLFPLLCSTHGLTPGPGWRWAGRRASSATGLVPAERLLLPQLVLSQVSRAGGRAGGRDCRIMLIRPACSVAISQSPGKDSRLLPSGSSVTVLISLPARRGLLTSHTQMKAPP